MSQMHFMNRVEFGAGAVARLAGELDAAGIRRPLLVTDAGLVATGLAARVGELAGRATVRYDGVPPNPTEHSVLAARQLYLEQGCDGIVALGGGSPLDFAKAVALLATHPLPLERYALIRGGGPLIGPAAPVIAIPTTAGTGSEVGRGALITLASGAKLVFASHHLLPVVALCDPALTVSLPPALTAATGMDALTHCIEAYLSPRVNPPVDAIVLDGASRAWHAVRAAIARPRDLQARADMMLASIEGGLGFQKGLGAVHALSHPLGALKTVTLHHGTCNAVILPAVLRFNQAAAGARLDTLRRALDLPAHARLDTEIERLNAALGLPASLAAMGVRADMLDTLAAAAMQDHSRPTNPRELREQDARDLYLELLA
ncbi:MULTISPECIES: iron-containing alcohol dehydrogenase [Cupriavidus]